MRIEPGIGKIYLLLVSRLLVFAFFQASIAVAFRSWTESEKYWMVTATLTNVVSIYLLITLLKNEEGNYLNIFRIDKGKWKKDVLIFIGLALLIIPLALVPGLILSNRLWGNTTYYHHILFQPISTYLVYFLLFAFPVSIGLAELPTYFGYIMPRLGARVKHKWLVLLLPVLFLSVQHGTLPLVFDIKFVSFRMLMYLPLSLILGIALYKRPSLLPYLAILHSMMDAMAATMLLAEAGK